MFVRKGYAAASVREIVAEAGVTKPVLYYYYGNKEGIYAAVVNTAFREFDERVNEIEKLKGSAAARLKRLCEEVFALSRKHLDVVRLMHAVYFGPPQGAPGVDFDRALFRLRDAVRKIIGQGVRAGEFAGNAEAMTVVALGALNECIDLELVLPGLAVDEAGFGRVLEVVLRGMKKGKSRR